MSAEEQNSPFSMSPLFFFNFPNSSTQNPLLPFPRPKKHAKEENENKQILKKDARFPKYETKVYLKKGKHCSPYFIQNVKTLKGTYLRS